MMEQVTITAMEDVASGVNDKTGKSWQLIKISVKGKEPEFKGFANKQTSGWTVGSVVDLSFEQDAKYGWQFKVPNATDNLEARVTVLEESVNALLRAVPSAVVAVKQDMPSITDPPDQADEEEIPSPTEDDLPF